MLEKYFWKVWSSFFRTIDKEYNSFGISFSVAKIWLFLIKCGLNEYFCNFLYHLKQLISMILELHVLVGTI